MSRPRVLRRIVLPLLLAASLAGLSGCVLPFGDPVCGWRVTLRAFDDANGNGIRDAGEGPVPNARFVITVTRSGQPQQPQYLGADSAGEAVYSQPGVGSCPDTVQVRADGPAPYVLTTAREADLKVDETQSAEWGFAAGSGPAPTAQNSDMICYKSEWLRGAVTGRLLTSTGELWVSRIDKTQPLSLIRRSAEITLTVPGLSEAYDPTTGPDGSVWVAGGTDGGVARYSNGAWQRYGRTDGLPADSAFSLEVAGGQLWALTWEGPAAFDPAANRWQAFESLGKAYKVLEDGDTLWFPTASALLQVTAKDPGRIIATLTPAPPGAGNLYFRDALVAGDGAIWMAGERSGESLLAAYSPGAGSWTTYTYDTTLGRMPVAEVRGLVLLPDGTVFIRSRYGGFRLLTAPSEPAGATWASYPDFAVQTSAEALQPTADPVVIAQLVRVSDASGFDRYCRVW